MFAFNNPEFELIFVTIGFYLFLILLVAFILMYNSKENNYRKKVFM